MRRRGRQSRGPVALARLPRSAKPAAVRRDDLFDGIVTIVAEMDVARPSDGAPLYQNAPFESAKAEVTAIPYYLWCNRGPNRMVVWLPES